MNISNVIKDHPNDIQILDDANLLIKSNNLILDNIPFSKIISNLQEQINELKSEIIQLKYRPPNTGCQEYEDAKINFQNNKRKFDET